MVTSAEVSGAAKATSSGFQLLGRLVNVVSKRRETLRLAREARQLLGLATPDMYSYRVAMHHPLHARGDPHPDDLAAFITIAGHDISTALEQDEIVAVDDLTVRLQDGLVLIGSPEAEAVTRLAFGYASKRTGHGLSFHGMPFALPYRWEENPALVSAKCDRYVPDGGRVRRPNWPIVSTTGGTAEPIFPKVANNGLLKTDLLLVTRVPNFLTAEGFESGRSLVSIAGTHGTATRSIELLLRDKEMLAEIARAVPEDSPSCQILLEAGDLEHDPKKGTRARSLRIRDVKLFEVPASRWRDARRLTTARFASWLKEVSK